MKNVDKDKDAKPSKEEPSKGTVGSRITFNSYVEPEDKIGGHTNPQKFHICDKHEGE